MRAFPKPLRVDRKAREQKTRAGRRTLESKHKRQAKARDLERCRFPLCGCQQRGFALHAAHVVTHKGMVGDKTGGRSVPDKLLTLCGHRHQWGLVSWHRGTLRVEPLTPDGTNGPVRFLIDVTALPAAFLPLMMDYPFPRWHVVAEEIAVQIVAPMDEWQVRVCLTLRTMEL